MPIHHMQPHFRPWGSLQVLSAPPRSNPCSSCPSSSTSSRMILVYSTMTFPSMAILAASCLSKKKGRGSSRLSVTQKRYFCKVMDPCTFLHRSTCRIFRADMVNYYIGLLVKPYKAPYYG